MHISHNLTRDLCLYAWPCKKSLHRLGFPVCDAMWFTISQHRCMLAQNMRQWEPFTFCKQAWWKVTECCTPSPRGHFTAQLGSFLWIHIQLLHRSAVCDSDLMACLKVCPDSHPIPLQKLVCGHGNKASAYPTSTGSTWGYQPCWSASVAMPEFLMCFHYSRCYCLKLLCLYEIADVKVPGIWGGRALLIVLLP